MTYENSENAYSKRVDVLAIFLSGIGSLSFYDKSRVADIRHKHPRHGSLSSNHSLHRRLYDDGTKDTNFRVGSYEPCALQRIWWRQLLLL